VFTQENKLYGELSAAYHPPVKNHDGSPDYDEVATLPANFAEFRKQIHTLFGLLYSDIEYKSRKRDIYLPLLELSDPLKKKTIVDYFKFHLLLRQFLGELGLFKITNVSYKAQSGASAFSGIVDHD